MKVYFEPLYFTQLNSHNRNIRLLISLFCTWGNRILEKLRHLSKVTLMGNDSLNSGSHLSGSEPSCFLDLSGTFSLIFLCCSNLYSWASASVSLPDVLVSGLDWAVLHIPDNLAGDHAPNSSLLTYSSPSWGSAIDSSVAWKPSIAAYCKIASRL